MSDKCLMCDKRAVWFRATQFAGTHPFCEEHAKKEEDFGMDDSYTFWYGVKPNTHISNNSSPIDFPNILAGEAQMSDKGYSIGSKEKYDEFVKKRNSSKNKD